ncbi:hypothetical protein HMPREF9074_09395 [Capnocytophaga sp. oral taxon 329 str. F0087]|nr:hypothetical protein HMPREF9074_09395 [Capnocytophaga sp. oral taxon 329 str. F0087]
MCKCCSSYSLIAKLANRQIGKLIYGLFLYKCFFTSSVVITIILC